MTLSPLKSGRIGVFALAVLYTGFTFGAAVSPSPVSAKSSGHYYVAELAAPASESRVVANGVAWSCQETTCVAAKGTSRPLRMCRGIQREFGEVVSFSVKGKALDESKLAACNG